MNTKEQSTVDERKAEGRRKVNTYWNNQLRLDQAKESYRRRRAAERRRDLYDELNRIDMRNVSRKRKGIPLDAPLAKPWDFAKSKV